MPASFYFQCEPPTASLGICQNDAVMFRGQERLGVQDEVSEDLICGSTWYQQPKRSLERGLSKE